MTNALVKLAQQSCMAHGRCPHQDHCLDYHRCKLGAISALPQFPPIVRAEDMHRECVRDKWQMAPHPILRLRGNDHG